ncbi:MAG: hypothetical protein WC058_03635 [Phycisphaeraceae bacterium]
MPNPHPHTALALGLLWLALAPLAGCQHHTGDDWYCITLPNLSVPKPGEDIQTGIIIGGKLSTGHFPLHATDIQKIRQAMRSKWRDIKRTELNFDNWDITFNHFWPGRVDVTLTSKADRSAADIFFVYHTAEGWKVVAVWYSYA